MADTDPARTGTGTSEFKLSVFVAILGAVLSGVTVALGALKESFPDLGWLGTVAGVVAMAASVLGYAKSRATVKSAELLAANPSKAALLPPKP